MSARSRSMATLVVAGGAAILLTATPASASARPVDPQVSETVTIVFAGAPGAPGTVVARGAISDTGTLTPTDSDVDTYVFPDGSLSVRLAVSTAVRYPRPPLCVTTFRSSGTFVVVGGTGRFAGVTGAGTTSDAGFTAGPSRDCAAPPVIVADYGTLRGKLTR